MKKILIIFAVLVLILASLLLINKQEKGNAFLTLNFSDKILELSYDELLQYSEINKIHFERLDIFIFKLNDFIQTYSGDFDYNEIIFHSDDGARLKLEKKEIRWLYLSFLEENNTNKLRLVIPKDEFQQRWIKYINKIELIND